MVGDEAKTIVQILMCCIGGNTLRCDGRDDMVDSLHQIAQISDVDLDKPAYVDKTTQMHHQMHGSIA